MSLNSNMIETFRYLSSVEGATVKELASKVGVSERTIRRHLQSAEARFDGFTEEMETGNVKRYFIRNINSNFKFPTISSAELKNLDIIQSSLINEEHIKTMELVKAIVTSNITKASKFLADFNVLKEVEISPVKPQLISHYDTDTLNKIRTALLGNNVININYIRRRDHNYTRYEGVYPLGIMWGTRNYLVISKYLGDKLKPFFLALPNITGLEVSDEFFSYPSNFNMHSDYKHLFTNFNDSILDYNLIFEPHKILGNIREYFIHPTQEMRQLSADNTEVTFRVSGIDDVFNFILAWGNKVTIIAPQVLKDRVTNYLLPKIG